MGFNLKILFYIILLSIIGKLCIAQKNDNAAVPIDSNIIESFTIANNKSKLEHKIIEIKELLNNANQKNDQIEVEKLMLLLGNLYMESGKYEASIDILDKLNIITNNDTLKLKIFYDKASIYGRTMKYDKAINELFSLRKLNEKVKNKTIEAYALNHIGVIYGMQKSFIVAQKYINESLVISIENNDYVCMANAYSNLGSFCNQEDSSFKQYLFYTHKALYYYKLVGNKKYIVSLYNDMIMRFWKREMHDSVDVYINHMLELMPQVDFPEEIARIGVNLYILGKIKNEDIILKMFKRLEEEGNLKNNIELLISYHYFNYKRESKNKNFEKALLSYERYKNATDTFYMRLNTEKIDILERNSALEREQEVIKSNNQIRIMISIIIILLFILVIALLILIVIRHKSKIRKSSLERYTLQTKLDGKNKEIVAYLMQMIKIKETNNKIIDYLLENKKNLKDDNSWIVDSMIADLKNNVNNDFWEEFNLRFTEVNGEFYTKLNNQYPSLTLNQRKLCAFLYLDMSTKEIANITHQSIDSINLARTRLRKKLGLTSHNTPINTFLQNLA